MNNEIKPQKVKKVKFLTIGSSKNAQTQFKTALRNHIDLSSIADNKANIMLSVNALILTVAVPLLVTRVDDHRDLLIPTIILTLVSLISMIFATLSTRPVNTVGRTSTDKILSKKSNLFFFGNYYKMSFEEYEEGMKMVVADNEILDNSITRDLYFLGRALGRKYDYLRWCYDFFLAGIVVTALSYLITYLV